MTLCNPMHDIKRLYGNGTNLYIIDRLWNAGLLLKNNQKYTAVYTLPEKKPGQL